MSQRVANFFSDLRRRQQLLLPVWFEDGQVIILDQTRLPFQEHHLALRHVNEVAVAIKAMQIRGSGAIALAGAWGLYLAALTNQSTPEQIKEAGDLLKKTRPTAVNLQKTIDEITRELEPFQGEALTRTVEDRVLAIVQRQLDFEIRLGHFGAQVIGDGDTILTHCHSGALAGAGYGGRALSVLRAAVEQGKRVKVIASETRPYLQGARITAWELGQLGIPVTLITDNMSGFVLQRGMADLILVGSDRVAANGDLANKVGTYLLALAARDNDVPFYTATSSHTIDLSTPSGKEIAVEMRDPREVLLFNGAPIAPESTGAIYPSFDITPAELISGIITERGVLRPPYREKLAWLGSERETR